MSEIRCIRRRDAEFPHLLASIHDPPPRLYARGAADVALLAEPAVAIVGARACSAYGRSVTRSLARELAAAGLVVVSGMARGIDGEAHRGALEGGGRTVAVLGCGIDRDYPAAHAELARRIGEDGTRALGVRAGRRAGAVALSCEETKGPLRQADSAKTSGCLRRTGRQMRCWCGPGVVW